MRSDRNIENDQIKKPEGHTCKKMQKEDLLLYAVTDRHWLNGETLYSQVEKTLEGGTTFVQLREKELDEAHFLEEAKKIKELCDRYHVPFVINDNVDIALEIDADGVHVGQSDMEAGDVRAKLGPDKIIGVSAQTVGQALLAQERGADYLGVGAVFHTDSKADAADISHETLKAITEAVDIPVIAIGGISKENVSELSGTGICGIAVISAIFAEKDIKNATKKLKKLTEEWWKHDKGSNIRCRRNFAGFHGDMERCRGALSEQHRHRGRTGSWKYIIYNEYSGRCAICKRALSSVTGNR